MNITKWKLAAIFAFTAFSVLYGVAQESKHYLSPEEGMVFDKLALEGNMSVVLVPGDRGAVWVEHDDEGEKDQSFKGLNMEHDPDSLYLRLALTRGSRWQIQTLYVQYDQLKSIECSRGIALKNKDTIRGPALDLQVSGTSDISLVLSVTQLSTRFSGANKVTLSGKADNHNMNVSGVTSLNASTLKTLNMNATTSGASQVMAYVTDSLKGTLSGTSHFSNKADPVFFDVEASGLAILSSTDDTTRLKVNEMEISIDKKITQTKRNELADAIKDEVVGDEVKIKRRNNKSFRGNWGGFGLGFNGFLNADHEFNAPPQEYEFLKLNEQKSLVVNINLFQKNVNLINNRLGLVTGIGLQYNNYRFRANTILSSDSAQIYGYFDTDPDKDYIKSKLLAKYVTVPVLLEYNTNGRRGFHIGAGAQFAWMYGSHSKIVYELDRSRQKVKDKGSFHLSPYNADLMLRIGWNWVNLFATYSITEMFRDDRGPQLHPFTIGLNLISW